MSSTPFYWEAKEQLKNVTVELDDEQIRKRDQDREMVKAIDEYYAPYRQVWRNSGALFNLIQTGTDDTTSNWYMGWARLLINHSMAMLTAGDPKGAFTPIGNKDYKMSILVSALVENTVRKCNWHAHQRLWMQDLHIFGNGVTESYSERPMRKSKVMRGGKMIDKIVRDHRRSKVGIRRKSPFRAMRSHFISDPDDVPYSIDQEEGTYNQYVMKYVEAYLPDGTKKYDTDQIPVGSHYRAVKLYDELENCYRTYLLTYGGKPESTYEKCPPVWELGYPIYDKPLSRYKFIDQGRTLIGGANVMGMSPLAFATFDDQLDPDMETYSICGMGIPQIIAGPEAVMHGLINMSIDNERMRSTVPISYEPNSQDSPSALDLDVRSMYSGLVIDGKITPQPLGLSSAGSNQVLWEWLKFVIYQLTGINPEGLTGDGLQTAYQSGLLVRQMNMRSKARINAWENGPLKRAWTTLGANALSDVTTEEWEEITEDDAKRFQESIKNDEATAEDYDDTEMDGDKKIYKKRVYTYIPVKGYKFREDFTGKNKKRVIGTKDVQDTLIEDPTMRGNTSHVVASAKYLLPSGDIQSVFDFMIGVDASGLLQDLKTQDVEMMKNAILNAQQVAMLNPSDQTFIKSIDQKKMFISSIEPTGLTEDDVMKTETTQDPVHAAFKDVVGQLEEEARQSILSPSPNVQPSIQNQGMVQQSQGGAASASGAAGEVTGQPVRNPAIAGIAQG